MFKITKKQKKKNYQKANSTSIWLSIIISSAGNTESSIKELEYKEKHKEGNQIIQKMHPEFSEISNTLVLKIQEIRTIVDLKVIIIMIFALKSLSFSLKSSQFQNTS